MSPHDDIAPLIAWYATGALDPKESARVESHLGDCDTCRDLLATARAFRRLAPGVDREVLFDHIQAQRLVEFAEDPAALEPDARTFIRAHVATCAPCAEALEILEDLARTPAADDGAWRDPAGSSFLGRVRRTLSDLWGRMGRTLLHPAPALGYLAALVVLLVLAPFRSPDTDRQNGTPSPPTPPVLQDGPPPDGPAAGPPMSVVPPGIELPEEVVFRGGAPAPSPISIALPAGADDLVLDLVTSIEDEDRSDPVAVFRVTLVQEGRVVAESARRGADFDRRGRLRLVIDPDAIAAEVPCLVRITRSAPGEADGDEEVYRRSFVLARDASGR